MKITKQNTKTSFSFEHKRFTAYVDIDEYLGNASVEIPNLVNASIRIFSWKPESLRKTADIFNKIADKIDEIKKESDIKE